MFFFPIYFFWKHPYRINIICSGWVSSVKFPLAGDPLQSLYDSRPYLPDLVFRGGGKLGWTQDELRVKILGSGSFTIPIFPNCTSLIWFAGTSEDRWIFRKNIGWRYHPIMVRKMWKDDGTQSLCNESDLCFCFFLFFSHLFQWWDRYYESKKTLTLHGFGDLKFLRKLGGGFKHAFNVHP